MLRLVSNKILVSIDKISQDAISRQYQCKQNSLVTQEIHSKMNNLASEIGPSVLFENIRSKTMTDNISLCKMQQNRFLPFTPDVSNRFSLLDVMFCLNTWRWTHSRNEVTLNMNGKYFWGKIFSIYSTFWKQDVPGKVTQILVIDLQKNLGNFLVKN